MNASSIYNKMLFCDPTKTLDERAADMISRMTIVEKIAMLDTGGTAIKGLGIPKYNFWSEASSGVANEVNPRGKATQTTKVRGEMLLLLLVLVLHVLLVLLLPLLVLPVLLVLTPPLQFAFPITTAMSFNRTLWRVTGEQIGREARAMMCALLLLSSYSSSSSSCSRCCCFCCARCSSS